MDAERPGRRVRGAIVALALVIAVAAGVGFVVWGGDAPQVDVSGEDGVVASGKPAAQKPKTSKPRGPRVRALAEPEVQPDLEGTWKAALALWKAWKPAEALSLLAPLRRSQPEFFAEPARAKALAEMEKAALDQFLKLAKNGTLDEVRKLASSLSQSLFDAALLTKMAEALAAAEKTVASLPKDVGGAVVDRAATIFDKVELAAHLFRFAGEGSPPSEKAAIDDQLAALAASNLAAPVEPLVVPDAAEAEKRRLAQLEQLRQRDVVGLLGNLGGSLAWLALHQADDGHFGADATAARCAALKHPECEKASTEKYQLAATSLAVLAFLDFRDQDARRLFEPTLARGIRWLVAQQEADGSFKLPQGAGYSAAIALMALGQAASSTKNAELKNAVTRGMNFYAGTAGADGGWRYQRGQQPGDLSVTGWYAQALEAAVHAGAVPPSEFRANLERFVTAMKDNDTTWWYRRAEKGPWASMAPVGMLVSTILREFDREKVGKETADAWRAALAKGPAQHVYMLYYVVRVSYLLDGKLPEAVRKQLDTLASGQTAKGTAAGMFTLPKDPHFKDKGGAVATAFATLTLEHALYRR